MFLLIQKPGGKNTQTQISLHSIMFLLIPVLVRNAVRDLETLHSIMFLLIQTMVKFYEERVINFTFHNVSINTVVAMQTTKTSYIFTFHNVSINTLKKAQEPHMFHTLHSIMFLLIP